MSCGVNMVKHFRKIVPKFNHVTKQAFSKYLLCTNVIVSASLSALGDVFEQKYEMLTNALEQWDSSRTCKMSGSGVTVGIFCHFWYQFLDRRVHGNTIRTVAKKIFIDQLVGSPLCISTFLVTVALIERNAYEELRNIKKKAIKLYIAEWIVWPPAQFINFYFLPTKFRVLYDNMVSLGYDIYTSYVTHSKDNEVV